MTGKELKQALVAAAIDDKDALKLRAALLFQEAELDKALALLPQTAAKSK